MAKNKLNDLRDHLFDVIERLKDPEPETKLDLDTAQAITNAANAIIGTVKAENDYLKIMERAGYTPANNTGFIDVKQEPKQIGN